MSIYFVSERAHRSECKTILIPTHNQMLLQFSPLASPMFVCAVHNLITPAKAFNQDRCIRAMKKLRSPVISYAAQTRRFHWKELERPFKSTRKTNGTPTARTSSILAKRISSDALRLTHHAMPNFDCTCSAAAKFVT